MSFTYNKQYQACKRRLVMKNNILIQCSSCLKKTSHKLLYKKETTEFEEETNSGYVAAHGYFYHLYECCGCHNVVMSKIPWCTEVSPEDYTDDDIMWYPALVSRNLPKWHHRLPRNEQYLLKEIFRAYHSDSKTLALMGLRTILDLFIVRKIGDIGTFKQKLEKLGTLGFLSASQIEIIDTVINAGSAAVHRAYQPSNEKLVLILDIVETLLHQDVLSVEIPGINDEVPARLQTKK